MAQEFSVIRRIAWGIAVVALAALGVYFVQKNAPAAPLPEFELSVTGGQQSTLGAPVQLRSDTVRVRGDARVQIAARPASKPDGAIAARAFLLEGGVAKTWNAPIEVSDEGVVRIAGEAGTIFPQPTGDWEVVVAIARPALLPIDATVVGLLGAPVPAVKTLRCHVVVK